MTLPLFLLLFATTYFLMSGPCAGNFSQEDLTRTDALYLAVTIFTTVGFGDISAASQGARLMVMFQMLLDLVIIAVGAQRVRQRGTGGSEASGRDRGDRVAITGDLVLAARVEPNETGRTSIRNHLAWRRIRHGRT